VSLVGRLEKSLEFLKANAWGRYEDKIADQDAPDGFKYCAQGAIAYGGFAGADATYCPERALFHKGECDLGTWNECATQLGCETDIEFRAVRDLCDRLADETRGAGWGGLTWYNDDTYRTKEDMVKLLEKAIERAKEEQQA
jgi:hypothetical protein